MLSLRNAGPLVVALNPGIFLLVLADSTADNVGGLEGRHLQTENPVEWVCDEWDQGCPS